MSRRFNIWFSNDRGLNGFHGFTHALILGSHEEYTSSAEMEIQIFLLNLMRNFDDWISGFEASKRARKWAPVISQRWSHSFRGFGIKMKKKRKNDSVLGYSDNPQRSMYHIITLERVMSEFVSSMLMPRSNYAHLFVWVISTQTPTQLNFTIKHIFGWNHLEIMMNTYQWSHSLNVYYCLCPIPIPTRFNYENLKRQPNQKLHVWYNYHEDDNSIKKLVFQNVQKVFQTCITFKRSIIHEKLQLPFL